MDTGCSKVGRSSRSAETVSPFLGDWRVSGRENCHHIAGQSKAKLVKVLRVQIGLCFVNMASCWFILFHTIRGRERS